MGIARPRMHISKLKYEQSNLKTREYPCANVRISFSSSNFIITIFKRYHKLNNQTIIRSWTILINAWEQICDGPRSWNHYNIFGVKLSIISNRSKHIERNNKYILYIFTAFAINNTYNFLVWPRSLACKIHATFSLAIIRT